MPCCHDNHNTVIKLAMQRRAAFSWAGQKAMRSLRSSSLRSPDALHLSSYIYKHYIYTSEVLLYIGGRGLVSQIIEPVTFARCAFIIALRNIALDAVEDGFVSLPSILSRSSVHEQF